jgi:competence CoiA-like predicted nuclease
MPLRAVNKEGQSCYSFHFPKRSDFEVSEAFNNNIFCPITKVECFIRYRAGAVPHFVRKNAPEITLDHHPESVGHETTKHYVYEYYQSLILQNNPNLAITLELPLPTIGKHGRIADVAIYEVGTNTIKSVIECQLSRITPQELEQRTNDYEAANVSCLWVLGADAAESPPLVAKCEELFGTAIICEFIKKRTTIKDMFEFLANQ